MINNVRNALLPRGSVRRNAARWVKNSLRALRSRQNAGSVTHIFVACFQKSGSSYLARLLSNLTGFPMRAMVSNYGQNEQDVSRPHLEDWRFRNSVTQQHARGTHDNVLLLKEYGIKPIILVRNIFDVTVSLRDHIEKRPKVPTGYVHRQYWEMSEHEKLSYLIKIHLPWYFNFYVSWLEASNDIDVFWTSYEALFADQIGTVQRITDFLGVSVSAEDIADWIKITTADRDNTRLNVGVSGRGVDLSDEHKDAILALAAVWKVSDWGSIGIDEDRLP